MNWRTASLRDCVTFSSGGTPNKGTSAFWIGDIPWVSSGEMSKQFLDDTSLHISEAGAAAGSRVAPAGTIFAVVRGMSLATEFRVSFATRRMAFNQDLKALAVKPGVDAYFLFSALRAHASLIRDLATEAGHGTKKLEMERFESFQVRIPDIETQQRIAALIKAYDDLIENNRRRIKLMEEAARRLYREWFVALRFSGHERVKIVDGVPQGWVKGNALDFVKVLSGGTPKTNVANFWDGGIPFFTPKDSPTEFFVNDTEKTLTDTGLANCNSRLFPRETIFITARGTVGKMALNQRPMAINQSCYAVVPAMPFDNLFLFLALLDGVAHFKQVASGGVFDAIVVDTFKLIPFLLPPAPLTSKFGTWARPLFGQMEILTTANARLKQARDTLLPRLVSGALAV